MLAVCTVDTPQMQPTEMLVHNAYCGINFIDVYHRSGVYAVSLPFVPGREAAGTVVAVGALVAGYQAGDRVAYTGTATYAELTAVNPHRAVALPQQISFATGAAVLLQGLTALTIAKIPSLPPNATVLVHAAAGGTGLLLVQVLKSMNITVIGVVSSALKQKIAEDAHCDHVINRTTTNVVQRVLEITQDRGVACVFDGVGQSTLDISLASLARFGMLVSFGNASGKITDFELLKLAPKCITLARPSLFAHLKSDEEYKNAANELMLLVESGQVRFDVVKEYELADAHMAHTDLEAGGTVGKLVLKIGI